MEKISVYSDGGARGNPGKAAAGYVIVTGEKIIEKKGEFLGLKTNNQAEYLALTSALKAALKFSKNIDVYSDSLLMINQLLGKYKVRNMELKKLHQEAMKVIKEFEKISFTHVLRENRFIQIADKMVNDALDKD